MANETTGQHRGGATALSVLVVAVTHLCVGWLALFYRGRIRIGVSDEWTWTPHGGHAGIDIAVSVGTACVFLIVYLLAVRWMSRGLASSGRLVVGSSLAALVVLAFVALWALQSCAPASHRQLKPMWVLYHWGASGYFAEAQGIDDLPKYLSEYEAEMAEGDVLHKGTHPPGLVIGNVLLLRVCRGRPNLVNALLATMPESVNVAFRQQVPGLRLSDADRAALWLSVMLTQILAAATVIPVYLLIRQTLPASQSLQLSALWPLVPGLAVFLPKSDAIYPLLAASFAWLSLSAWDNRSVVRGIGAGLVFWLGMMLSLAMLPVAVVVGLYVLLPGREIRVTRNRVLITTCSVVGSFVVATLVLQVATDLSMWKVWLLNYHNHAGFYDQFPRTWWRWLLANPLELLLTLGGPLTLVAAAGLLSNRRQAALAVFGVWAVLWFSGKNMGEAARLWLFLTPLFLWAAAGVFADAERGDAGATTAPTRLWWVLAACQALIAILTASLVNGFSPPL